MSNALAIAAVTRTLRDLLYQSIRDELANPSVTALPPDRARENRTGNQVNLFLYHTQPSLERHNQHPQFQLRRGETCKPPLALDLYYLITTYGEDEKDEIGHQLLGRFMSFLHDRKQISPSEIEMATAEELSESDLHHQIDRIQIWPLSLSFEEMCKLWQSLQTRYRLSVAYRIAVILLDSQVPLTVPPPVLSYSFRDRRQGNVVQWDFLPSLSTLRLPNRQPSAQLGDRITLEGQNLDRENLLVRLKPAKFRGAIDLEPLATKTGPAIEFALPAADALGDANWACGVYAISLVERERDWQSNALAFTLAPCLRDVTPQDVRPGNVTLQLTCAPPLQRNQKATLLWGDRAFPTHKQSTTAGNVTALTCHIRDAQPGEYVLRLRVDGVDSLPIDFSTAPWGFDTAQTVRVVPAPEEAA